MGTMSHLKHAFTVLMASLLMASAGWAQVSRGTITGIVTDPSGAVVPGVTITITNIATGVANAVASNSSGLYTVHLLSTEPYALDAEKACFKRFVQAVILDHVGE